MALGNQRPALMNMAENRLWRAIIDIATTRRPITDILSMALQDIKAMISVDLNACQPHWFRAGQIKLESLSC
jgi:hypothetical protein